MRTTSWAHALARVQLIGQHNFFHLLFPFVSDILSLCINSKFVYTWLWWLQPIFNSHLWLAREVKWVEAKDKQTCCLCIGKGYQRWRERANGRSYAGRLPVLLPAHVLMKLLSLLLHHPQRINTSFCLVTTNQQSPDSGDFVARKFQCKVTRPLFFFPNIKKSDLATWD